MASETPLEPRGASSYAKLGTVGEGTFGVVSCAKHTRTDTIVAIKKIRARQTKSGVDVATLREAMLLSELRHPNVIALLDVYTHNGAVSLVFEFCPADIEHVIKDRTAPLDAARIKAYMRGALAGLAFCHANWMIHRDIKPGNLLLSEAGVVKLADFGLARTYGSPRRKFTGHVVTRWYRPPELLFGAKFYGPAVDLWSIGCVFAELLTRAPLFPGNSDIDQLARIFTLRGNASEANWPGVSSLPDYLEFQPSEGKPLISLFPAASTATLALLEGLMSLDPAKRPTADEALASAYFSEAPPAAADADNAPTSVQARVKALSARG